MSMEFDTVGKQEQKSEAAELKQKTKADGDVWRSVREQEPKLKQPDIERLRHIWRSAREQEQKQKLKQETRPDFERMKQEMYTALGEYEKLRRGLSPYDVIPPPPILCNGVFALNGGLVPITIEGSNRTRLGAYCKHALSYYNQRTQGPTFVFHQLVKCASVMTTIDMCYITFEAKEEHPSNSPAAITTFQAQVWDYLNVQPLIEVKECKIKI